MIVQHRTLFTNININKVVCFQHDSRKAHSLRESQTGRSGGKLSLHPAAATPERPRFPGLHPGLVCRDPLGHTEPHSQGCTLGCYAVTLWVTRNAAPMSAQPRRRLEGDRGMARSFTRSSPSGATCVNPGQRPGIHATHSPQKQQRRPPLRERGAVESGGRYQAEVTSV